MRCNNANFNVFRLIVHSTFQLPLHILFDFLGRHFLPNEESSWHGGSSGNSKEVKNRRVIPCRRPILPIRADPRVFKIQVALG
jgi:hypothetical protein